jgi:hypothetical protein
VEAVPDKRVRSVFEQRGDRLALSCLRGDVDRGDALAVGRPPERAALIGVGAKPDRVRIESTRPFAAAQVSAVPR